MQSAFEKLLANPLRHRCFKIVTALFGCYLISLVSLYIPESVVGTRFYDWIQQWCRLFCRASFPLMAAAILPGEAYCFLVDMTASYEQMLRKSSCFLGENSKTMILMKPRCLVYDEIFQMEEQMDLEVREWEALFEKEETKLLDYIQMLEKMMQRIPEVAAAYQSLEKKVKARAGKFAHAYWKMACMEVCLKQYEIKNQEFLQEEGFEHYRNVCGDAVRG